MLPSLPAAVLPVLEAAAQQPRGTVPVSWTHMQYFTLEMRYVIRDSRFY